MECIYKINLIPNDLSMEGTILQIADTLDNLNGIVDDVFTRIMNRININMDETHKLQERISSSRTKVETLVGMQKAIKVFSSAKYSASIEHQNYESIFDRNFYKHEPKKVTLSGKAQRQSNETAIQEKLHFFHVKVAEPKTTKPKSDFNLKAIVNDLSTVGELLIYNSDESPYLGAPSKAPAYVPSVSTDVEKKVLEEAPPSIMNKNILKREIDEYMYAPGMGMVPELDMPLDLPHLPGIAGDVQFSITGDGSIAPSAITSPVVPLNLVPELELPELPDLQELPDVKLDTVPDIPDAPPAPPAPVVPVPPSMPLPPPPPPPPPPPVDLLPTTSHKRKEQLQSTAKPAPAPVGDAHSSLMAAIRQAGGVGRAKLKSAADTTPVQGAKQPIGGDLMADLHAKLSMRRRGISGAERSGGTVLHTLARVIPEAGESSPPQSSSGEDWE